MRPYSFADIYLAYRQAKIALFFERRGVGLVELATFERDLVRNLRLTTDLINSGEGLFDNVTCDNLWLVPKSLSPSDASDDKTEWIGLARPAQAPPTLEIQVRAQPAPSLAIAEVLFLWSFGAGLDGLLSDSAVGYRLDIKDLTVSHTRRWLFEYWPDRYQEYRSAPVRAAVNHLERGAESVTVVSADLSSFYDSVDSRFLTSPSLVSQLAQWSRSRDQFFDEDEYLQQAESLHRLYEGFRASASRLTGLPWPTGIPIGPLTSRLVGNLALASLDRWVLGSDDTVSYRRYVDDFVIVSQDATLPARPQEEVLRTLLPLSNPSDPESLTLDTTILDRDGCAFTIQTAKLRVHHLAGAAGAHFLRSVDRDFLELVSDRRAFLDDSTFLEDSAARVAHTRKEDGTPIRALRDADRVRLQKFALSTALASLERVAELTDATSARAAAIATQVRIAEVLDGEADWLAEFELALRLLRLAVASGDVETTQQSLERMAGLWGEPEVLRARITELTHHRRPIRNEDAWSHLRDYLHARQLETMASAVSPGAARAGLGLGVTLVHQGGKVGIEAIRDVAQLLASADLRARDRETDGLGWTHDGFDEAAFAALVADGELRERFDRIDSFVRQCQALGDDLWAAPAPILFLSPRPPSYFDVARRWLAGVDSRGFGEDIFETLLGIVNAVRGTEYYDPVGLCVDEATVTILGPHNTIFGPTQDPRVILGNWPVGDPCWEGAATRTPGSNAGRPLLTLGRLKSLARTLAKARLAARAGSGQPSLLVLPELSLPRAWLRDVAHHVAGTWQMGLVAGLEYAHEVSRRHVRNEVVGVFPGTLGSVATWLWTKGVPAREERALLAKRRPPLAFAPKRGVMRRPVVHSDYGSLSVLVCSELIETRQVADLLGRVELVLVPAWNKDTASYDHLIQSVGLQLNAVVAVANNGEFSDCRAWAPRYRRWARDLCRVIARGEDEITYVDVPLAELRAFRASGGVTPPKKWRALPPEWP